MEKISIIVPIYNVDQYLEQCVNSLLNQDYENLEILLIDDGSSDNSGKIADNFKEKYASIKVYHKENGGLSDARNYGIDRATGKYIAFVDSDDYVEKDYISSMYRNILKHNIQIASCGFCHVYDDGSKRHINFDGIEKKYLGNEAQKYLNIIGYFNVSSCNKLFDINLFQEIRFPKGKKSEDWYIMYKLIEKAGGIYYSSIEKYMYRQRLGSITKSNNINVESINAAQSVVNYFYNNKEVYPYAVQSLVFAIIGVYNVNLCNGGNYDKYYEAALKYKKGFLCKHLSCSRKIQVILFFYCINIYNVLFKIFDYMRKNKYKNNKAKEIWK